MNDKLKILQRFFKSAKLPEEISKMSSELVTDVIIIGAGLTGLSLARELTDLGKDILVLEARDRIGGRIHTYSTSDGAPVEMGATWFFPHFRNLFSALKELNIDLMEQYMKGGTMYESDSKTPPRKVNSSDDGDMFRIKGGTSNIVNTLYSKIDPSRVVLSQVVTNINQIEGGIEVVTKDKTYRAKKVVTTIPPQLLAHSVSFQPSLPTGVINTAKETQTWMGDSMKGAITYSTPFWKEKGLAGALYSSSGPFQQMYDQTSTDGTKFALVGFMHPSIARFGEEERRRKVVDQLVRVFGEEARNFLDYKDTYWSEEEFTMPKNAGRLYAHKNNGHSVYQQAYLGGNLYIGGTETASQASGYMEGAVNSAKFLAKQLKDDFK